MGIKYLIILSGFFLKLYIKKIKKDEAATVKSIDIIETA